MQTANIRRSIIRLAGGVAIMTGIVMSSGTAGATHVEVGITECDQSWCAVVTIEDLKAARAERDLMVHRPRNFPTDRFSPRFVP